MSEKFTIESIKAMEADIKQALQTIEKTFGVSIKYETPNTFSYYATKLTLEISKPMPFEDEYRRVAEKHGLKLKWLGACFWTPGATYRIIGFNGESGKVVAARRIGTNGKPKDGTLYQFKPEYVAERMVEVGAA